MLKTVFFFSSRRRHTRFKCDWSSDVCSSDRVPWLSTMAALIVLNHGTDDQRRRFLPRFARGEARGGLALTEPHAGTDVQAIRAVARRRGDAYVLNGTKMFVTNGRERDTFALLALTDPA